MKLYHGLTYVINQTHDVKLFKKIVIDYEICNLSMVMTKLIAIPFDFYYTCI